MLLHKYECMYYRSGTGRHCCIDVGYTLHENSPGGRTFLHGMTSWPPSWCHIRNSTPQIDVYLLEEQS